MKMETNSTISISHAPCVAFPNVSETVHFSGLVRISKVGIYKSTDPIDPISHMLTPAFLSGTPLPFRCAHQKKRPPRCVSQPPSTSHTVPIGSRTQIHTPIIHRYTEDTEETYAMWYTTHVPDQGSAIHLATSSDGFTFTPIDGPHAGAVLSKNEEQWWAFDTRNVALGDIVSGSSARVRADGDVVFLYYTGFSGELESVTRLRAGEGKIGVALSKDGQHFSRIEGELPSGAVLEGDPGAFDAAGVFSPCICSIGTKTVMHYHTYSQERGYQIGRAESDDGILFRKTGPVLLAGDDIFASDGMLNPCVVANGKGYMMFVEVVSEGRSGIAVCESDDLNKWGPVQLVLNSSHTNEGTGSPYALPISDGSLRLYYTRYEGEKCSLAFAESQGTDWTNFNTIASVTIQ